MTNIEAREQQLRDRLAALTSRLQRIETELDVSDLAVQTYLNGDLKQDGRTSDMVFDVPTLIEQISAVMTLLPGDVILTGTPAGVGPMEPGDEVEVFVQGIGNLNSKVVKRD